MRRSAVALVVVLLAGGAWIAYSELWSHGGGRPVAWRNLPGSLGAAELSKPVFLRFRKRRYLQSYLAQVMPGRAPKLPPIDFTRDEALLAGVGARSSTGYSVHIVSVSDQRARIVVRVRETAPSLGQRVIARVTYPYAMATIPQSTKRVHFVWLGRP
jgi:hypothetical protein